MTRRAGQAASGKPAWLKVKVGTGGQFASVRELLDKKALHTVCQEALCPNKWECWAKGAATFLILGDTCTRGCGFCAVKTGAPAGAVGSDEQLRLAAAVKQLKLKYVVVTSVTRDDLPDGGAGVFADTVRELKKAAPAPLVELLIPDLSGAPLETVMASMPDVLAHNVETVERISRLIRHPASDYRRSLRVLAEAHRLNGLIATKSSVMLGLGESEEELHRTMDDLLDAGVRILVLGQYLRPTRAQVPVVEYISPERFEELAEEARRRGFAFVVATPMARTSYRAEEAYAASRERRPA